MLEVCLCDVPIFKDRSPTNHRSARFIQSVKKLLKIFKEMHSNPAQDHHAIK